MGTGAGDVPPSQYFPRKVVNFHAITQEELNAVAAERPAPQDAPPSNSAIGRGGVLAQLVGLKTCRAMVMRLDQWAREPARGCDSDG